EARKVVSKKVDILCNDLITAYGDLSKQFEQTRTQDSFQTFVKEARDLEQMLCHTMDWLLRQMGYCNIAIYLAADRDDMQLGAYMKYKIPGEDHLTDAMRNHLVPMILRENVV